MTKPKIKVGAEFVTKGQSVDKVMYAVMEPRSKFTQFNELMMIYVRFKVMQVVVY